MNRQQFVNALTNAKIFLMKQDFIPVFTYFQFKNDNIVAHNEQQAIQIEFDHGLETLLPGDLLVKLLNTMSSNEITIKTGRTSKATLKGGKSNIQIPQKEVESYLFDFPNMDDSETDPVKLPNSFFDGLKACSISVAYDPSNPEFNGIVVENVEGHLCLYSSDAITLSKYDCGEVEGLPDDFQIILPDFYCQALLGLYKQYIPEGDNAHLYFFSENDKPVAVAIALNDTCRTLSKLFVAKRRDYEQSIRRGLGGHTLNTQLVPDELVSALDRAILMKESGQDDVFMNVSTKDKSILLTTTTSVGTVEDEFFAENELQELDYKINPILLERGLQFTSEFDVIQQATILTGSQGRFTHIISHV